MGTDKAGAGDFVPVRLGYEEPFVWLDPARGRERLAAMRVVAEVPVPIVDMSKAERLPPDHDDGWDDDSVLPPLERRHDGSSWRRLHDRESVRMGLAELREWAAPGDRANEHLRMDFGRDLTTAAGEPGTARPGTRAHELAVERFRADAEAMATDFATRMLAFDGECAWIRQPPQSGSPLRRRYDTRFFDAHAVLLEIAAMPGVDPDLERLSAPVRRAMARDRCGSLGTAGLPDALRALDALCTAACARMPRTGVRWGRLFARGNRARNNLTGLVLDLPSEDEEALVLLGPAGP
jgi:hypothetical protein